MNTINKKFVKELVDDVLLDRSYVVKGCVTFEKIYNIAEMYYETKNSIKMVGLWGATDKTCADKFDNITINNLKQYFCNIKNAWPFGCEWEFILCNVHALLNGYSREKIDNYLLEIEKKLNEGGFKVRYLDCLWKNNKVENKINERIKTVKKKWNKIKLSSLLEKQAKKHDKTENNYVSSAQRYYSMRYTEAKLFEEKYSNHIFTSMSSDRLENLYPDIPKLYLWSLKRGTCNPSWLIKE